jgi:hypothetical protein
MVARHLHESRLLPVPDFSFFSGRAAAGAAGAVVTEAAAGVAAGVDAADPVEAGEAGAVSLLADFR